MLTFLYRNFEHVLFALILVSRLGDIGSTYLVTPSLRLEANPIAKRLGWRFAVLSLLVSFIAYLNTAAGVMVLTPSLLVSSSNIAKAWMVRAMGEEEFARLLLGLARRSRLSHAVGGVVASASFILLLGAVTMLLCFDPARNWGYWIGVGITMYGVVVGLYGSLFFVRLFRKARGERLAVEAEAA
jgi:hypothetical protein